MACVLTFTLSLCLHVTHSLLVPPVLPFVRRRKWRERVWLRIEDGETVGACRAADTMSKPTGRCTCEEIFLKESEVITRKTRQRGKWEEEEEEDGLRKDLCMCARGAEEACKTERGYPASPLLLRLLMSANRLTHGVHRTQGRMPEHDTHIDKGRLTVTHAGSTPTQWHDY